MTTISTCHVHRVITDLIEMVYNNPVDGAVEWKKNFYFLVAGCIKVQITLFFCL